MESFNPNEVIDWSTAPEFVPGEKIVEVCGASPPSGGLKITHQPSKNHSLAYVKLAPGKSSSPHFHPNTEEIYFLMAGKINLYTKAENEPAKHQLVSAGQTVFIPPKTDHVMYNDGDQDMILAVTAAPAWVYTCSVPSGNEFVEWVSEQRS